MNEVTCYECELEFNPESKEIYLCPTCQVESERLEREKNQCKIEESHARNIGSIRCAAWSAFPDRIQNTDIARSDFNLVLWEHIKAWKPTSEKPWLGFCGQPGKCKTRIAYMVALKYLEFITTEKRVPSFVFTTAYAIGGACMDQFGFDAECKQEARDYLARLRTADLVLVDDMDKVRPTPAVSVELFSIFNSRYAANLATIWTSNVKPEAFAGGMLENMAGPFAGRFNECSRIMVT